MQPVRIMDPHLVSTFYDDFKRSYLHCTLQLENRSSWLSDCKLKIQVSTELEGNICLVEHLQSYEISVPPNSVLEYTIPPVSFLFLSNSDIALFSFNSVVTFLKFLIFIIAKMHYCSVFSQSICPRWNKSCTCSQFCCPFVLS
jgi:hypothetical protein